MCGPPIRLITLLLRNIYSTYSITTAESRLDVLINNAAIWPTKRILSEDGYEMMFATNHLGNLSLYRY